MCTRALWTAREEAVLVGRNMDYAIDLETNLWAFPRGIKRDDGIDGQLQWTSTYGSVAAGAFDIMTNDGMNEAGLAAHLLWLTEADYGEYDEQRPALALSVWLQYVLDNFATVSEAVSWFERSNIQIVGQSEPDSGRPVSCHLAIDDASGDSAIIEFLNGQATIWHDTGYTVMTNSPPYGEQLQRVEPIQEISDDEALPGGTQPTARFARAAYYLMRLPKPSTQTEAIASLLGVMRNVSQPARIADPGKPEASQTLWRTIADLSDGVYVFESTGRPNIVWTTLDALDLAREAPVQKLDLVDDRSLQDGLVGDITAQFSATAPMEFLRAQ